MAVSNTGLDPVRGASTGAVGRPADRPAQTPMAQQNAYGSHGYDMYPQEFVRLAGCQELKLRRDKKRALLLS
ncbi:hypothetical protein ACQR1I_14830 [Bradyrhizobium sp. HKCCYLS2038]|uniref:hypothetical protein n=1 Tax=unclassified Bradyrhizobium TaxID=2631580 RepID=UPI003EB99BF0